MIKYMLVFFALIGLMVSLSGCEVSKDFSFDITKEFVVSNYASTSYTRVDSVDARTSSSDFEKYKSDMESLDIASATYTITYFTGPASQEVTSGTLVVGELGGSATKTLATLSNINLLSSAAKETTLPLDESGKQFFKDQLWGPSSGAKLYLNLTTNEAPVNFTVRFKFHIKATYATTIP